MVYNSLTQSSYFGLYISLGPMQTLSLLRYAPENRFTGAYLNNSSKKSTKLGASLSEDGSRTSF